MTSVLGPLTLLGVALSLPAAGEAKALPPLTAKWIWKEQPDAPVYNQTVLARKTFPLVRPTAARVRITADCWYRLTVNGRWVGDGPCRAWPEHYRYDSLDVSSYLKDGDNTVEVIARYYGVGDFHRVPQRPGLLVQFDAATADGPRTLVSDESWQIADAPAWRRATPKVSIQMEPAEVYDARRADDLKWSPAAVVADTHAGPWKDLKASELPPLTRQPFALKSFGNARVVRARGLDFCLPAVRLMHPGLIEANGNVSGPCGMASLLHTDKGCTLHLQLDGMKLAVDGKPVKPGAVKLEPGKHLLLAYVSALTGHNKEKSLRFMDPEGFTLANPVGAGHANPWCFLPLPQFKFAADDLLWQGFFRESPYARTADAYNAETDRLMREVKSPEDFAAKLAASAKVLAADEMFVEDTFWPFTQRRVVAEGAKAAALVSDPAALLQDTPSVTTVRPSPEGDVELLYDLGEQNVGYWTFELTAPAGTVLDLYAVEYIAPDGRVQFSWGNRNALRYVTREGVNRFTSLKRRSGRYLFVTLRHQKAPVAIRHLGLIESTYPVEAVGSFSCSDARLDRIWDISTRTLKLCMEDTFTDCPLYEQTHWVGDARNESLFAYPVFGATDLGRHCIRVTGDSLGRYPITGCQTPSSWDVLIPVWSFLWGISTWDYYWHTGDQAFLKEIYPAVIRNLKGAEGLLNEQGLLSVPYWNFFDWTPIDAGHRVVTHNSLFLVGAIDAALKEAEVLGDKDGAAWLRRLRERVAAGVRKLWDPTRRAFPDSVLADGKPSPSSSVHTSFLSLLYDVATPEMAPDAKRNVTDPPPGMVRLGSPFAALYLLETLEKLGLEDRIVEEIRKNYLPMLEAGATTVWESFPSGTTGSGGFPTRSHTHAWSSAPCLYLPRVVLGVKQAAPGGTKYTVSPRLSGLEWARGTVATVHGPLSVSWRATDKALEVECRAPEGVAVELLPNPTHAGRAVKFRGPGRP